MRMIVAGVLASVLVACGQETSVSVSFNDPRDLDAGAPVYLGDAKVGEVTEITTAGDHAEATLSLDPDLTAGLRTGSAALLGARGARTVIELYNYRPGEEPLANGDELVGLNHAMDYAAWQVGESMETGKRSIDEVTKSITDYFNSEEWRRQKEQMDRQLSDLEEEMGRAYEETNEAYRKFMEDLESQSESARRRAEESYAELAGQLKDQIARLREEGNENLVEPLQRFLEDLSRALKQKPEPKLESA